MGYFNIFYKITRVIDMLTRKRNRKFIAIILIIIAVIFILHNKGYCAQEDSSYTTDTTNFIIENYQTNVEQFVISFDKCYGKIQATTNYFNEIFNYIQSGYYIYFYRPSVYDNVRIYMYTRNSEKVLVDTNLVYNDGTRVPSTAYNMTHYANNLFYFISTGQNAGAYNIGTYTPNNDINYTVPFILLFKIPSEVVECMEKARLYIQ